MPAVATSLESELQWHMRTSRQAKHMPRSWLLNSRSSEVYTRLVLLRNARTEVGSHHVPSILVVCGWHHTPGKLASTTPPASNSHAEHARGMHVACRTSASGTDHEDIAHTDISPRDHGIIMVRCLRNWTKRQGYSYYIVTPLTVGSSPASCPPCPPVPAARHPTSRTIVVDIFALARVFVHWSHQPSRGHEGCQLLHPDSSD